MQNECGQARDLPGPNKFFEADGRVVDASGQDWDETWVTPASVETLNSALTGGVSQNDFRKLNDEGS